MVAPTNLFIPDTPHGYRPAGEHRHQPQPSPGERVPAGGGGQMAAMARRDGHMDGGQMPLADAMARAIAKEGGAVGRYDVARRLVREREAELLTGVARGDQQAFQELDQLRRGPLYFPASRFEGAVDYGPGAPSHAMRPNGDFRLGVSNTGDDLPSHPAVSGAVPRVTVWSAEQSHRAHPQQHRQQHRQQLLVAAAAPAASRGGEERSPQRDDSERRTAARRQARREKWRDQEQHERRPREERHGHRSKPRAAPRRQSDHVADSSPFIGSGVPMERTDGGRSTAGKPAGVWNGGGHLPDGKRHLSEKKHLPGWTGLSTVAGQRQLRDEMIIETARVLPAGWAKLRSRSMPAEAYYHDARSGESQWKHPYESPMVVDVSRSTTAWEEETPRESSEDQSRSQQRGVSATSETSTLPTWTPVTSSGRPRSRDADGHYASRNSGRGGGGGGGSVDPAVRAMRPVSPAGGGSWSGLNLTLTRDERHSRRRSERHEQRAKQRDRQVRAAEQAVEA